MSSPLYLQLEYKVFRRCDKGATSELVYAALGRKKRSRSELEKLYAEEPDFEDVTEQLGVA